MPEMKILWFTSITPPSVLRVLNQPYDEGPASWVENLRRSFEGQEITLGIASPASRCIEPITDNGVTYYTLPAPVQSARIIKIFDRWRLVTDGKAQLAAAKQVVRQFQPDLIHVHGTENVYGMLAGAVELPVVVSLQGILSLCQLAYFKGLALGDIARLFFSKRFIIGASEIHGYLRMRKMARRERRIVQHNRFFIGRTSWDRDFTASVNPRARYFHGEEVMRSIFYDTQWNVINAETNTIFCTSSSMLFKGVETLLQSLAILYAAGLHDIKARIVGVPESSDVMLFYARKARQYGVADRVEWLGRLSAPKLVQELLRATVCVNPTHIDNSPNSLVEAMLVGVPTVASRVGGIPSLLDDGVDGWLYPDGDAQALAEKIQHVLHNPQVAAEAGQRARERSLQRNDPDNVASAMLHIYKEIAANA